MTLFAAIVDSPIQREMIKLFVVILHKTAYKKEKCMKPPATIRLEASFTPKSLPHSAT